MSPSFSISNISRGTIHNSYIGGLLASFIPDAVYKIQYISVCVIFAIATAVVAEIENEDTMKLTTIHTLTPVSIFTGSWKNYIRDYIDYTNR